MPKRKKISTEVWVALIGLIGVIIAAVLGSPILIAILQSTPTPPIEQTQASALTPQSTFVSTSVTQATVTSGIATAGAIAASPDCIPSDLKEVPAQATAIIEPLEGTKSQVPFNTLRYENRSSLRLSSGITIDFKQVKSFELSNPDFINHFTTDVVITFLDCTTHQDVIQSESGSFLTANTQFEPLELHILKVKRVDFEW
jgi:hypothetical protein